VDLSQFEASHNDASETAVAKVLLSGAVAGDGEECAEVSPSVGAADQNAVASDTDVEAVSDVGASDAVASDVKESDGIAADVESLPMDAASSDEQCASGKSTEDKLAQEQILSKEVIAASVDAARAALQHRIHAEAKQGQVATDNNKFAALLGDSEEDASSKEEGDQGASSDSKDSRRSTGLWADIEEDDPPDPLDAELWPPISDAEAGSRSRAASSNPEPAVTRQARLPEKRPVAEGEETASTDHAMESSTASDTTTDPTWLLVAKKARRLSKERKERSSSRNDEEAMSPPRREPQEMRAFSIPRQAPRIASRSPSKKESQESTLLSRRRSLSRPPGEWNVPETTVSASELRMLLGGAWQGSTGERYEVDIDTRTCTKWQKGIKKVYNIHYENNSRFIFWAAKTFSLDVRELKAKVSSLKWRRISNGEVAFQWQRPPAVPVQQQRWKQNPPTWLVHGRT